MFLAGRDSELDALRALFDGCRAGRGAVAVVCGAPAVGKTALVHTFADGVAEEATVLRAIGSRAEQQLSYGVIGQLFDAVAATSTAVPTVPVPGGLTDMHARHQAVQAVVSRLAGERPLVLVVDDLDQADLASLHCLLYLSRRVGSSRLLIVATEGEYLTEPYLSLRDELLRQRRCRRTRLLPLSPAAVLSLLTANTDEATAMELMPAYHTFSGGNPLLLDALVEDHNLAVLTAAGVRHGDPVVGDAYRKAVLACLHRCPPPVTSVAAGLAVLDQESAPALLTGLLGLEPDLATRCVLVLTMAGLVRQGRLRHPAAGAAVLDSLSAEDRANLHARARSLLAAGQQQLRSDTSGRPGPAAGPRAADTLATVLAGGATGELVAGALARLDSTPLSAANLETVEAALLTLVYADQAPSAAPWCDRLLAAAARLRMPLWHAVLALVRAEIALRCGDLHDADRHAAAALEHPSGELGPRTGSAVGLRVLALTGLGAHAMAAEMLRYPVPDAVQHTRHGLVYLHARGTHHLATGHLDAAVADFGACGVAMARRDTDTAALVPWRSRLAQAHAARGERELAVELANQELARCGPTADRSRGIALTALARGVEPRQRLRPLRQAADLLHRSGDRFELAGALAQLGRAYHETGRPAMARTTLRRADRLATGCAGRPVDQPLSPGATAGIRGLSRLSAAERKVATLAARGSTNREIAGALFITVSTVEQHLTRVYRKLDVRGRAELAH